MKTTTETRRSVMTVAWCLFRTAADAGEPRSFADALSGAWRWVKKLATVKRTSWSRGSGVARSAVVRHYGAGAFVGGRSSQAYLTALIGA
jgi:hypothetical protein